MVMKNRISESAPDVSDTKSNSDGLFDPKICHLFFKLPPSLRTPFSSFAKILK